MILKSSFFAVLCALFSALLLASACANSSSEQQGTGQNTPSSQHVPESNTANKPSVNIPDFSADSAYWYTKKQVDFGARVPGTKPHKACADWLETQLRRFADTAFIQKAKATAHDGKQLPIYNIIGIFRPEASERVLLCAHWDTRPVADQDDERKNEPILGANDGASGVGVLLEIARQLQAQKPTVGVDIVLFDTEDYGQSDIDDSYCLGSQYWASHLHKAGYKARYGILLDMVGAPDAMFLKERWSMNYAPATVAKVWSVAAELGFESYFPNMLSPGAITDDHYYVNKIANIPTIDIIHYTPEGGFAKYWHTHDDNMNAVSKNTLDVVGTVLMTVVYRENLPNS